MTASPYDMVAYRPAAKSALTRTTGSCLTPARLLRLRDGRDRVSRLRVLRPDEVDLAARLVLRDHERQDRLARRAEFQDASGQDRVLDLERRESGADRVRLRRARLLDRGEERVHGLVRAGVVPLRRGAGGRLELPDPRLH